MHVDPKRVAHRYLLRQATREAGAIDSDWVTRVRKAWKAQIKIPALSDDLDARDFIRGVVGWLDKVIEDILFHRGFYAIPSEGPRSIPSRLKDKVIKELRATREILTDVGRTIKTETEQMDPGSRLYRMEGGFTYSFYQKQDPRSPLRAFYKAVRIRVKEAIVEADKAFSRRMLAAITRYMDKYQQDVVDFGRIDLKFNVGRVNVVYQSFQRVTPQGGPLSALPSTEGVRWPDPDAYGKLLKTTESLMGRAGLKFLWYGNIYIRCKACGGENHLGGHFGVGARYYSGQDAIQVYNNPTRGLPQLIAHELGHRYYYRFMTQVDRAKFDSYFGDVAAVSEYGSTISSEDFAEVFSHYVMQKGLTRGQLERFKTFLGRTNRMAQPDRVGGHMHADPKRVAHRYLLRQASFQSDVGSAPLATVLSLKVGGMFGENHYYIKTPKGWVRWEYRGRNVGRETGQVARSGQKIRENDLRAAYDEGTLGLMFPGVKKGGVVRYTYQLEVLPDGAVVEEPTQPPSVKKGDRMFTVHPDGTEEGPYKYHHLSGVLQDGRAKWVR